jgi:hypothetical protein
MAGRSGDPRISIGRRGRRAIDVTITDASGLEHAGTRRITVRATDLAENVSTRTLRLPRC